MHPPNVLQKINGAVLAARAVFDQARDQAVFWISRDHQRRDFRLSERLESLEPPLPTDQIVERSPGLYPSRNGNRLLEPDLGDVVDDVAERLFVSLARVDDVYTIGRDHFDPLCRLGSAHAAALSGTRAVSR